MLRLDEWMMGGIQLAQLSPANRKTTQVARDLLAEITTWKLTQAIAILTLTYAAIFLGDRLVNWFSEKVPRQSRLVVKQSLPLLRALILVGTITLLSNLLLDLSDVNLLAVTGTVAVTVGFAFKDYASSVIAGVIALFESPYQVGDRIQIGEYYGEVITYGLRGIRLTTPGDRTVTIPHSKIWTESIVNANKGKLEAQTVTDFYCAHDADIQLVTHILYRAAQTSKYTQLKRPIAVTLDELPWCTHFQLKAYPIDARDEFVYKTDLLLRTKQVLKKHNVAYPSPEEDMETVR